MIRKICPICDQVMKSAHYCKNCRSWVKEPYVRDVTYYLNERHPARETGCSYHGSTVEKSAGSRQAGQRSTAQSVGSRQAGQSSAGSRQTAQKSTVSWQTGRGSAAQGVGSWQSYQKQAAQSGMERGRGAVGGVRVKKPASGVARTLTVLAILMSLSFAVDKVAEEAGEVFERNPDVEEVTAPEVDTGEGWEDGCRVLEDEEVIAAGIPCNMSGHFEVAGKELVNPIMQFLEEQGYAVAGTSTYSYNEEDENGSRWYSVWTDLEIDGGEDSYQYVELDYDTADGRLHCVVIELEDAVRAAGIAGGIVDILEEHGALGELENAGEVVRTELTDAAERREDYELELGSMWVSSFFYEAGTESSISIGIQDETGEEN